MVVEVFPSNEISFLSVARTLQSMLQPILRLFLRTSVDTPLNEAGFARPILGLKEGHVALMYC